MSITITTELTAITCPTCSGVFAITQEYKDEARKLGGFKQCWTCPYCKTSRGFGDGEADNLKRKIAELESEKRQEQAAREYAQREFERVRLERNKAQKLLKQERKRVGNGVCPCCNRSFSNLRRHMASKHPGHGPAEGKPEAPNAPARSTPV